MTPSFGPLAGAGHPNQTMTSNPVQEETAMPAFRIVFTDPASTDEPAAIWSGYEDYAAARRALADADLMIPLRWTHTIEEDPDATNSSISPSSCTSS